MTMMPTSVRPAVEAYVNKRLDRLTHTATPHTTNMIGVGVRRSVTQVLRLSLPHAS